MKKNKKIMKVELWVSKQNGKDIQTREFEQFSDDLEFVWDSDVMHGAISDKWLFGGCAIDHTKKEDIY